MLGFMKEKLLLKVQSVGVLKIVFLIVQRVKGVWIVFFVVEIQVEVSFRILIFDI